MNNESNRDWIRTLEGLRYDVLSREPLCARKEYGTRNVIEVTLDLSGQIRMTLTRQQGETRNEKRKAPSEREYQIFTEQNRVTIANYRLRDNDDLAQVLREMETELARN